MCDADVKCSIQLELLIAHLLLRIQSVIQEILPAIQFHTRGSVHTCQGVQEARRWRGTGGREKRGVSLVGLIKLLSSN